MQRKKKSYFMKRESIINKGINNGLIVPFDEKIYDILDNVFVSSIPVSLYLKYFNSIEGFGNWHDKSLYMFFAIPNTMLVTGKCNYNDKIYSDHGWIEDDKFVYDPATLMTYDKELYYLIYNPTDVYRISLDEYCEDSDNKKLYKYIKNNTLNDYMPGGYKRNEFLYMAKLLEKVNNEDIKNYLESLDYGSTCVIDSINDEIDLLVKSKR